MKIFWMSPVFCPLLWSSRASKPSCWCEPWSSSTPTLPSCQGICSWCSQRSTPLKILSWEPWCAARAGPGLQRRFQLVPSGGSEGILEKFDLAAARVAEMAEQAGKPWEGTAAAGDAGGPVLRCPPALRGQSSCPAVWLPASILEDTGMDSWVSTSGCEQAIWWNPAHLKPCQCHFESCPAG